MTVYKGFSMQRHGAGWSVWSLKFDHITPVLKRLYWLPVRHRVMFKIMLPVYKRALHAKAPSYISGLLKAKPVGRYSLRSDSLDLPVFPRTMFKTLGDRAFAGPSLWNELPVDIRRAASCGRYVQMLIEDFPF